MTKQMTTEEWVDKAGLHEFFYDHLETHLLEVGNMTNMEIVDEILRLSMISLRQELERNGWRNK